MQTADHWPFAPNRATDLVDTETLAVIEAGCCERLERAMTILDRDASESFAVRREDIINRRQHFSAFCRLMRDSDRLVGGNQACRTCDVQIAEEFTAQQQADGATYAEFRCHMGLSVGAHAVRVNQQLIAVMLAGQFRPAEGVNEIQTKVRLLGATTAAIRPLDDEIKQDLLAATADLSPMPVDFHDKLAREAGHVERLLSAEFRQQKSAHEHRFLKELRFEQPPDRVETLANVARLADELLQSIRSFCGCSYTVLFASVRENETVLTPIASTGLPAHHIDALPHFNWKKAGLPTGSAALKDWQLPDRQRALGRGLRGGQGNLFENAFCIVPMALGAIYQGVLLFGPFVRPVDLETEHPFLEEIARVVGWSVLTELQILNLQVERKRWESTARLLTHQLRTALTPITTYVGTAKMLVEKPPTERNSKLLVDSVRIARDLCLRLGKGVGETVKSHVLLLAREDLVLERFPLSVLVANCADGFAAAAKQRQRDLIVDDSIESLPQAQVDVARLTIALSNIIENALKYSFPGTRIVIRAHTPSDRLDLSHAVIEVQDDGDDIPQEKRDQIFEQGMRVLTLAKQQRIPGTGLGLWEARAVIEAHNGKIEVRSEPTSTYSRHGRAHRVTFHVRIPLSKGSE